MKLTIERAALLRALGHVQSAVERRNTIPILSNVLLSAERGGVSFSATDLDMEIVDFADAQVDTPGQITAPAHTLYEIVRKLPEGSEVSLSYTGEDPRLQVRAGRYKVNLPVLPAGDFPVMPPDGLSDRIEDAVDYREVAAAVREVSSGTQFHLLEALAAAVADALLERFPVESVRVRVRKPTVALPVEHSAVTVERSRGA